MRRLKAFATLVLIFCFFAGCASKPPVETAAPVAADSDSSEASAAKRGNSPPVIDSAALLQKEIAHGSFLRALALESQGEYALAEQFMMHARDADPENRFLAFAVLELMEKQGSSKEALALAEKAKNLKGKKTSEQYALLGRIYSGVSNLDSALAYYKKAVETNERNFRALYEYSLLLEIARNKEELIRVYSILLPQLGYPESMAKRQIALLGEAKKDTAMADLLEELYHNSGNRSFLETRIRLLLGMKCFEEALSAVEEFRADSAYADDSLSITLLVAAYVDLKKEAVALDTLNAIYKRNPSNEFALWNVALLESKLNQENSAKIHWGRLTGSTPYKGFAYRMLSVYAMSDGDTAKGVLYMENAYKENPMDFYDPMIRFYTVAKLYEKAYPVLDSAISMRQRETVYAAALGKSGEIVKELARLHAEYGFVLQAHAEELEKSRAKKSEALELRKKSDTYLLEALRLGGDTLDVLLAYGANLFEEGKTDSAVTFFKQIIEKYPQDPAAMNFLGYSLVDLNRNAEEVREGNDWIDRALALDTNLAYMDSKGWALFRLGKHKEALAMMERVEKEAIATGKEAWLYQDTSVFAHLAAICEALSENERAADYYEKVLKIDPENDHAKKQIEILRQTAKPADESPADSGKKP